MSSVTLLAKMLKILDSCMNIEQVDVTDDWFIKCVYNRLDTVDAVMYAGARALKVYQLETGNGN